MNIPSVTTLLSELLKIPSPSGEETTLLLYCEKLLAMNGFKVKRIFVGDGTFNLYATVGAPAVVLQAHVDVVAPDLPFSETETTIFGRGACDTKASASSMICAAIEAKNQGVSNFGVLLTVGEEADFRGAQAVQESKLVDTTLVIVGEPTGLQPITKQYGLEVYEIIVTGKTAHSSTPNLGINAVENVLSVLSDLKQCPKNPASPFSIMMINGGIADNVIPDRATALISIRVAPTDTIDYAKELLSLISFRAELKTVLSIPKVDNNVPKQLAFLGTGQLAKYCTELAFFPKGIVLGPGNSTFAHTSEEQIEKQELQQAVTLYKKILMSYATTILKGARSFDSAQDDKVENQE